MSSKLFTLVAIFFAPYVNAATALDDVNAATALDDMTGLTERFSRVRLSGDAKPRTARKGVRRILTLEDLRRGRNLRSHGIYSIDGNIVTVDPEKKLVTIDGIKHTRPAGETSTDFVYRILKRKKRAKAIIEFNRQRRQALMAKRRNAARPAPSEK